MKILRREVANKEVSTVEVKPIPCLVCEHLSSPSAIYTGRPFFQCPNCGLGFFDTRQASHLGQIYARAYEGQVSDAQMQEYQFRARWLSSTKTDVFASPAVKMALRWL